MHSRQTAIHSTSGRSRPEGAPALPAAPRSGKIVQLEGHRDTGQRFPEGDSFRRVLLYVRPEVANRDDGTGRLAAQRDHALNHPHPSHTVHGVRASEIGGQTARRIILRCSSESVASEPARPVTPEVTAKRA